MDAQIKQLFSDIVHLSDQLKRASEESRGYYEHGDTTNALRNTNDSRDELRTLMQKWDQLTQLLSGQR